MTMTHKAMSVSNYSFTSKDRLFLDANIWLYLHGPLQPSAHRHVKIYSQAFKRILSENCQLNIDVLVVSEFVNRYARILWKNVRPKEDYKKFRNGPRFKPVAQNIAADVRLVLQHCSRIESGFAILEINDLLNDYAAGSSDFNDQVITELCKEKGLTLITNDGDFKGQGIPLLTANQRLLV